MNRFFVLANRMNNPPTIQERVRATASAVSLKHKPVEEEYQPTEADLINDENKRITDIIEEVKEEADRIKRRSKAKSNLMRKATFRSLLEKTDSRSMIKVSGLITIEAGHILYKESGGSRGLHRSAYKE